MSDWRFNKYKNADRTEQNSSSIRELFIPHAPSYFPSYANLDDLLMNQRIPSRDRTSRRIRWKRQSKPNKRDGSLTVEFALALPILILFFMASLDFGRANLVRHTINNAAFEAARAGIIPGATVTLVENRAQQVLATAFVQNADIDVTPGTITDSTELISVTVSASMDDNSWLASWFFAGKTISRTSTVVRETY